MISLPSLVARACRLNPQGIATRYADRAHTWSSLQEEVARLAQALQSLSLAEGDRIALLGLNSDRYYIAMFAIPWGGYAMVPLNTRWALPEIQYGISDTQAKAVFFDEHFVDQVRWLREHQVSLSHCIFMGDGECPPWAIDYRELAEIHGPAPISSKSGEDMAGVFYTGGTTGFPKGVMQSHRGLWASAVGAMPDFAMSRESVYLHCAPMFHMADIAGSMVATLAGASHVMIPRFDPVALLKAIADNAVTHTLLVPSMIKMVLNHPALSDFDVSSLERLLYGASPMPAEVLKKCLEVWPHVGLVQAYGQSELAPVATTLSSADHLAGGDRLKSAGRPTAVSEIKIVDDQGNDCPVGCTGEIVVRGPHTMLGYLNKAEETANTVKDGWVHTGDAGYFNDAGYLFIADRVKDMIVSGGENVYSTEVENAVISHPAVQDVAVIGIPHQEWGEAVHAIVVLRPGETALESDIIQHCRGLIAGYKIPKSVAFRSEPLPLTGAGKVMKTELRLPYWAEQERQIN